MAKNSDFLRTAEDILEVLIRDECDNSAIFNSSIENLLERCRAKFKENIGIESVKFLESESNSTLQIISDFIHHKYSPITGKIGALIKLQSSSMTDEAAFKDLGSKIAKQAVALNDQSLDLDKLLNSEYLFSSVGSVKNFIALHEEILKTDITLKDVVFAKIK